MLKRFLRTRSSSPARSAIRSAVIETLEARKMLAAVTPPSDYVQLGSSITVSSDGTPANTGIMLESGVNYFVKSTGRYNIAPGRLADAQYYQQNTSTKPWARAGNGVKLVVPGVTDWGQRNTDTVPEYGQIIAGTGSSFSPSIFDTNYSDNSGYLSVGIFAPFLVDLQIHKPAVIDPNEAVIPDADEETVGSATFVNLDNDDNDEKYDNADDVVTGGDDELVKLTLRVKFPFFGSTVKLTAPVGAADIKVWTSNDKAAANSYTLGDAIPSADLTKNDDWYTKDFCVEGITPQIVARGTMLKLQQVYGPLSVADDAALTVMGIKKVEWTGESNGLDDSSTLDADPNWPSGLTPGAKRVFPDKRVVTGGTLDANARSIVHVKTTLSVAPPFEVKTYMRVFDTDDPTADNDAVDTEAGKPTDNRGAAGTFGWQATGVTPNADDTKELTFAAGDTVKEGNYIVSTQPGDNFRAVANADKDFLLRLNNNDDELDVGGAIRNINKQRIVSDNVPKATAPTDREVRQSDLYCSDVLTVWRFMHIETDSMATPTDNFVTTTVTSITPTANGQLAGRIYTALNPLQGSFDLTGNGNFHPDLSPNLSNSDKNGRFEHGLALVGTAVLAGMGNGISGNGDDFIQSNTGFLIPFHAVDNDNFFNSDIGGYVTALNATTFTVRVLDQSEATVDWPDFIDGMISVGGEEMKITATNGVAGTLTVAALKPIKLTILDDDDDSVLPGTLKYNDLQSSDDVVKNRFAQAYIRPVHDGGGELANNQTDVPTVLHTEFSEVTRWQSRSSNSNEFWTFYHLTAFEDSQSNFIGDGDPDSESIYLALANLRAYSPPGQPRLPKTGGVLFYMETLREAGFGPNQLARIVVHETGHNFGLIDVSPPAGFNAETVRSSAGIMYYAMLPTMNPNDYYYFSTSDLNGIRSCLKPLS